LKFTRRLKYYLLRLKRIRGTPHELALGIALGIFTGMMPIMPFQITLAVALALFFKVSKITAAMGTWVSNPLNWYFLYYFSFKIGAFFLGLSEKNRIFLSVMASIREGEELLATMGKMASAGGTIMAAFLLGGITMGLTVAIPSYFVFLRLFRAFEVWKRARRERIDRRRALK
jgi:hypothetical protein